MSNEVYLLHCCCACQSECARSSCHSCRLPHAVQPCHSLCVQHQSLCRSWQDMCTDTPEHQKTQIETHKAFLQVKSKANTVVALFSQLSEVQRVYAYLQLAKRFLFQCENQVVMYTLSLATCLYPVSYVAYSSCSGFTKCLCSLLRCIVWPHRSSI